MTFIFTYFWRKFQDYEALGKRKVPDTREEYTYFHVNVVQKVALLLRWQNSCLFSDS